MTPAQRILEARRRARETWLASESFECICGASFRCKVNYLKHVKSCLDVKYGKDKN